MSNLVRTVHVLVHPFYTIYTSPYKCELGPGFDKLKPRSGLVEAIRSDVLTVKRGYKRYIQSIPDEDVLVLFRGICTEFPVFSILQKNGISKAEAQRIDEEFRKARHQDALIRYARETIPNFISVDENIFSGRMEFLRDLTERLRKLGATPDVLVKLLGEYKDGCVLAARVVFLLMGFSNIQTVDDFCVSAKWIFPD